MIKLNPINKKTPQYNKNIAESKSENASLGAATELGQAN